MITTIGIILWSASMFATFHYASSLRDAFWRKQINELLDAMKSTEMDTDAPESSIRASERKLVDEACKIILEEQQALDEQIRSLQGK